MKTKFSGILTLLLAFFVQITFAQEKTVSGVVSDETGPLPGVNVLIKGTTKGTETDFNGKYIIKAKAGEVLVFSFVGMKTVEKTVKGGGDESINVTMESGNVLEEIVVVAYGTSKKSSITGSATQIKAEKIEMKNTADISKALASEAAGVQVINTSGQPGSVGTIRIRGFGSVNSSRAPLYVVDGLPFDGDIASIDPSDIETTTILKDASATALYGARGANGVILITTKKGKKGTTKIEVDAKTGINTQYLPMYDVINSPKQYVELTWEGLKNRRDIINQKYKRTIFQENYPSVTLFNEKGGIHPAYNMWKAEGKDLIDPKTGKFKNGIKRRYTPDSWKDAIFGIGVLTETSLKVSGGSEKTSHYTSLGYRSDEGYYAGSNFERVNVRSNILHEAKKWFKIGLNTSYSFMEWNAPGQRLDVANNGFYFVNNMPPIFPVYERDKDGKKIKDKLLGGHRYDYGFALKGRRNFSANINPAGALKLDKRKIVTHQVVVNPTMEFKITEGLKFITKYTGQFIMSEESEFTNPYYGDAKGVGRVYKRDRKIFSHTWNKLLTWEKKFDDHNFSFLVGHESYGFTSKTLRGGKSKIADYNNIELNNAVINDYINSWVDDVSLESYLAQLKYDYQDKYFLTLNGRRDGTSRFPNNKWGTFGAVGLGWMISRENFLIDTDWLKALKLKASYGVIGNQELLTADRRFVMFYPTFDNYTVRNLDGAVSLLFNFKGNPDLTWEKSKTFNTGVEFNINDRIEGSVEFFKKNTDNLLFFKQVPASVGYVRYPVNEGEIENTGVEFELTGHIIKTNDLKVDLTINGAHYKNKIIRMPVGGDNKEKAIEQHGIFGYQKGKSIYDYYTREYAGVNSETGESEWFAYYDVISDTKEVRIDNLELYKRKLKESKTGNKEITKLVKKRTPKYSEATQKFIGKSLIPKLSGGFGLNVSYKGFELGTQFLYSIGGYAYDSGYAALMNNIEPGANNWHVDILKRWTKKGDKTSVPRLSAGTDKDVVRGSSRFLTDASYLGLNNASLAYNFSSKTLENSGIDKLKLFVSGDNLFLFTARDGFNPNTAENGMSDNYRYSPVSTFSLGVKINF